MISWFFRGIQALCDERPGGYIRCVLQENFRQLIGASFAHGLMDEKALNDVKYVYVLRNSS